MLCQSYIFFLNPWICTSKLSLVCLINKINSGKDKTDKDILTNSGFILNRNVVMKSYLKYISRIITILIKQNFYNPTVYTLCAIWAPSLCINAVLK